MLKMISDNFYPYQEPAMNLTDKQRLQLKQCDLAALSHEARDKANALLNDQGFAVLSLVVSNFIADIAEHPEKLVEATRL